MTIKRKRNHVESFVTQTFYNYIQLTNDLSHTVYFSNQAASRRTIFSKVLSSRIAVSTKLAVKRKCDLQLCVQKLESSVIRILTFAKTDNTLPDISIFFPNTLISCRIVHSGNKRDSALQRDGACAKYRKINQNRCSFVSEIKDKQDLSIIDEE